MARLSPVARAMLALAASISLAFTGSAAASASSTMGSLVAPAPIDPWLSEQLADTTSGEDLSVLVHGTDLRAARSAVDRAGLTPLHDLERIGVAIASGTPLQVQLAARQPGVTYVEGDQPLEFHLDTSHDVTRGAQVASVLTDARGGALNGTGVSIAVIDSGVDPTHPFFAEPDGSSAVVVNMKNVCGTAESNADSCFVDAGDLDSDTLSAGGHGTHVSGIVAGRPTTLADGTRLQGAAPGVKLVSLSVGFGISIINSSLALEWVLENHAAPCGPGVSPDVCPPIKVTNNSYGPLNGGEFSETSATAKLQRALIDEGVVTVWANGNLGGSGTDNRSNPPAQDPTPGIISVASFFDEDAGTRDGKVSDFSSRGHRTQQATWPDISAPGENITSSCRPYLVVCSSGQDPRSGPGTTDVGTFNTISGTSMAAPHIAGIAAQLFQAEPDAAPGEVEHALKATAYKYVDGSAYKAAGGYTSSFDKGTGLVDVVAAVKALVGSRVANGSFELSVDGVVPDGWRGSAGTGYDTTAERSASGSAAVSISGAGTWTSDTFAVVAGESYGVAAVVTGAPAAAVVEVQVAFFTASGIPLGIANRRVPEGGELLDVVTVPEGANMARVVLAAPGLAVDDEVWIDDVWLG